MGLFAKRTIPLGNHKRQRLLAQLEILEELENAQKRGDGVIRKANKTPGEPQKGSVRGVTHATGVSGITETK